MRNLLFLIAVSFLTAVIGFAADMTKEQAEALAKSIGGDVHKWTREPEKNMEAPLQGKSELSIGNTGQTLNVALDCSAGEDKYIETSASKTTGGNYNINIAAQTGANGYKSYHSATISGVCPDGYLVCKNEYYCKDSSMKLVQIGEYRYCSKGSGDSIESASAAFSRQVCSAYDLSISGGAFIKTLIQYPQNCVCLNDNCGGGDISAVAKSLAEVAFRIAARNDPNVSISKTQGTNGRYTYYKSVDPNCNFSSIPQGLPSANAETLKTQGRALRTQEANNPDSMFSALLNVDENKTQALSQHEESFSDMRYTTNASMKTVTAKDGRLTYTAYMLDANNSLVAVNNEYVLPTIDGASVRQTCVVEVTTVADSKVVTDGTPAGETIVKKREPRLCDENNVCPHDPAKESVYSACVDNNAINASQSQIITSLESLGEVGKDAQCGGRDPKENGVTCDLSNITIFNGKARHCSQDTYPDGGVISIADCCKDDTQWIIAKCPSGAKEIAKGRDKKLCRKIGDNYCSDRLSIPFGHDPCIERTQGWCCFNSKLAKIIQEQGRPQVAAYYSRIGDEARKRDMGWGTPKNPNCKGLTAEEFQTLDFSTMDLRDFFGDIQIDSDRVQNQLEQVDLYQQNAGWREDQKDQQEREEDAQKVREQQSGAK
jgi:conjugal transfer mating pair stabilization protein TraN